VEPNYKSLLLKYMQHLQQVEESLFLELVNSPFSSVRFTEEELHALRHLEGQIESGESIV